MLRGADHVQQPGRGQVLGAVPDRGQVGGAVAVAAVALAHDQRQRLAVTPGEPLREHAQRAVALPQQAEAVQRVHDRGEQVVVVRLAVEVRGGQGDAELVVHREEVLLALVDQQPPQPQRGRVARLQRDHPLPGALGEARVGVELRPRALVEAVQVTDRQLVRGLGLTQVEQVLDEHAERRAPVADVVGPPHVVAEPGQRTRRRVADHGRAQVPDVHLLGHVGRRVVDDHGLRGAGDGHAQPLVGAHRGDQPGQRVVAQAQVDEARSGDLGGGDQAGQVRAAQRVGGDLARGPAQPPGQRQRAVGLEVGVLRAAHHGVHPLTGDRREGVRQPLAEQILQISHVRPAFLHHGCRQDGTKIDIRVDPAGNVEKGSAGRGEGVSELP